MIASWVSHILDCMTLWMSTSVTRFTTIMAPCFMVPFLTFTVAVRTARPTITPMDIYLSGLAMSTLILIFSAVHEGVLPNLLPSWDWSRCSTRWNSKFMSLTMLDILLGTPYTGIGLAKPMKSMGFLHRLAMCSLMYVLVASYLQQQLLVPRALFLDAMASSSSSAPNPQGGDGVRGPADMSEAEALLASSLGRGSRPSTETQLPVPPSKKMRAHMSVTELAQEFDKSLARRQALNMYNDKLKEQADLSTASLEDGYSIIGRRR